MGRVPRAAFAPGRGRGAAQLDARCGRAPGAGLRFGIAGRARRSRRAPAGRDRAGADGDPSRPDPAERGPAGRAHEAARGRGGPGQARDLLRPRSPRRMAARDPGAGRALDAARARSRGGARGRVGRAGEPGGRRGPADGPAPRAVRARADEGHRAGGPGPAGGRSHAPPAPLRGRAHHRRSGRRLPRAPGDDGPANRALTQRHLRGGARARDGSARPGRDGVREPDSRLVKIRS